MLEVYNDDDAQRNSYLEVIMPKDSLEDRRKKEPAKKMKEQVKKAGFGKLLTDADKRLKKGKKRR